MKQKYVIFTLNGERFAVSIDKVREICMLSEIVPVPASPPHIKGLMLERGMTVAIVDLKTKLEIVKDTKFDETRIIMMTFEETREEKVDYKTYGFLVNEVLSIIEIEKSEIDAPSMAIKNEKEYILGFIKEAGRIIIVLDTDKIL